MSALVPLSAKLIYTHVLTGMQEQAAETMERAIFGP